MSDKIKNYSDLIREYEKELFELIEDQKDKCKQIITYIELYPGGTGGGYTTLIWLSFYYIRA